MRRSRLRRVAAAGLAVFQAASAEVASAARTGAGIRPAPSGYVSLLQLENETSQYQEFEVRFPSPSRSPFPVNDTVWGHLYLPRGVDRPPCVLLLPVMAAPNLWIEHQFLGPLLRGGSAVFLLEMPYQFHRRPNPLIPSGQVFLARNPRRLADNFRQAVADARRGLDWLRNSGKVDPERLAVLGISLGAIVGSLVLSQERGLKGGLLLLGGADFPSLVMNGEMTRAYVRKAGIREEDLRKAWVGLDPLAYRDANKGKNVLLINVKSDMIIPAENARRLKEAFPDARQLWLPFGHYTAMLHLLWVPYYAARRLNAMLSPSRK